MSLIKLQHKASCKSSSATKELPAAKTRKSNKCRTPKKRVNFAPDDANVVSLIHFNKNDLEKMWYNQKDYDEFEQKRRITIEAVRKYAAKCDAATSLDPTEHCVTGLEQHISSQQIICRKIKAKQYARVVLEQQCRQRRFGISDPVSTSAISEMFSRQAGTRAHLRAVIDHALAV